MPQRGTLSFCFRFPFVFKEVRRRLIAFIPETRALRCTNGAISQAMLPAVSVKANTNDGYAFRVDDTSLKQSTRHIARMQGSPLIVLQVDSATHASSNFPPSSLSRRSK
jgi:hypothetical protein